MLSTIYPVSELFYSLQGEGFNVGKPAFFIRLAGCNLSCPWCDTDFSEKFSLSVAEIMEVVSQSVSKEHETFNIVITGGEPSIHDLIPLLKGLKSLKATFAPLRTDINIAIETNGTKMEYVKSLKQLDFLDWVTFSPKPQYDYSHADMMNLWVADEIKVVLDGIIMPNIFKPFVGHLLDLDRLYIQPCSEDFRVAVEFVKENPAWRLSVQTQKIMKIQ